MTEAEKNARRAEAIKALATEQWKPTWPPVIQLVREVEAVLAVADKWSERKGADEAPP
jgi:hypothetical protein